MTLAYLGRSAKKVVGTDWKKVSAQKVGSATPSNSVTFPLKIQKDAI